jgi:DNA-binding beta-propeller fold protein YncE
MQSKNQSLARTCAALCTALTLLPSPSFAVYEHWLRRSWGESGSHVGDPKSVAVASDGTVFIACGFLLRLDPATGVISHPEYGEVWIPGSYDEQLDLAIGYEDRIIILFPDSHFAQVRKKSGEFLFPIGTDYCEGSAPGQFYHPRGIATSSSGEIYVADSGNYRIQVFSPDGEFLRQWSTPEWNDSCWPWRIAVAPEDHVYVITSTRQVNAFDSNGSLLDTWGSQGSGPGQFREPSGIDIDADGFVYVSDSERNDVQRFTAEGELVGIIHAGVPESPASIEPYDVAVASNGYIYVADLVWYDWSHILEYWYEGTMVRASEPDLEVFVDGERFVGANVLQWPEGSMHEITTTASQFPEQGLRYDFKDWNGAIDVSQSIMAESPPRSYTASFQRSYRLDFEIEGQGTITPPAGWYVEGSSLQVSPSAEEHYQFDEWVGSGPGSYTGRAPTPSIQMNGPIVQQAIFHRHGFDFTISASDSDPFAVTAEPANGSRNLYLWLTCADRGLSALEADVSGSLEPLAFVPAPDVLNVYGPNRLFLAVGQCPMGSQLLGHWVVEDFGGDFCLEPSTASGWMASVDCLYSDVQLYENPRIFCFSSNGNPQVIGQNGCVDASAPIVISNLNARARMREIELTWEATGGSNLSGFRVERASSVDGPFLSLHDSPLRVEPPCHYEDREIAEQNTYFYRVIAMDRVGKEYAFGPVQVVTATWPHMTTKLEPIWPNPSAGRAAISFALGSPCHAKLAIYDVAGRLVKTVVDGNLEAGSHRAEWQGTDDSGQVNLPGVYFARLETQGFTQTRKLLYLRAQ